MDATSLDFTRVKVTPELLLPDNLFPDVSKICRKELQIREQIQNDFQSESSKAVKLFDKIFNELNEPIFDGVQDFVSKSLESRLFEIERICAATLLLDMHISDHEKIFVKIESSLRDVAKCIRKNSNSCMHVQRVRSNLRRKRNLIDLLESCPRTSYLFIMIEQSETLDTAMAESLVGNLTKRLRVEDSPTKVIMVLFCLSTKLQDLPIDAFNCFGKITSITTNKRIDSQIIKDRLLRCPGVEMKLGSKNLDFIYEIFLNNDASVTNLEYIFTYALHSYHRDRAYLGFCGKSEKFVEYHNHMCNELYCFYSLLSSDKQFPDDVTDLYDELLKNDTLVHSQAVYEAIHRLSYVSNKALMNRCQRRLDLVEKYRKLKESITKVMYSYTKKFENNEDCDDLRKSFIKEVLEYAEKLYNPLLKENRYIYLNDETDLHRGALDALRFQKSFQDQYMGLDPYIDMICKAILNSPSQLSASDLYHDVEHELKIKISQERQRQYILKPVKVKSTPKKKSRLTPIKSTKNTVDPKDESIDDIAKGIFMDLIAALEHLHMIKLLRQTGKGLLVKRSVWLT